MPQLSIRFVFTIFLFFLENVTLATQISCLTLAKVGAEKKQPLSHLNQVGSRADFLKLAKEVQSGGQEQQVVKVVYHRGNKDGPKVHFFNTREYALHQDFAAAHTGFKGTEAEFVRNYEGSGEGREYNSGSVVLSKRTGKDGNDQLLFEIWTGDTMDATHLQEFYNAVKKQLKIGTKLHFHPLGVDQEKLVKNIHSIPVITNDQLYAGRTYLPLNEGAAYGYVKFIDPKDHDPLLSLSDIAVFENVPNDIGLVGGVVTEEFQTPLSHVNVKSMNRGTVNIALRKAKEELKKYEGKPIELIADGKSFKIRELPHGEAPRLIAKFWEGRKPKAGERPQSIIDPAHEGKILDLSNYYKQLPTPEEHQRLIRMVGAKAANLTLIRAILKTLPPEVNVTSPKTMSAHFGQYDDFMNHPQKNSTPNKLIREILDKHRLLDPNISQPIEVVRPALEEIRNIIQNAEVPNNLIQQFKKNILEDASSPIFHKNQPFLLLRSSTNSEDMIGFSGAGLYNSTLVKLYEPDASGKMKLRPWANIEKDLRVAIPYVYSSVWNERAYLERDWYSVNGLQHLDVKAAIAIHGGFNGTLENGKIDETANGVAITTNIYNPKDRDKIYINAQHYGLSVTNPPSAKDLAKHGEAQRDKYRTEELLVTNFVASVVEREQPDSWKKWAYERRQASSVKNGAPIFKDDAEVRRLAFALQEVSEKMAGVYGKAPEDFIADLEWNIFGPNRTISINQSRPFTPPKKN